mgnify:FL=1
MASCEFVIMGKRGKIPQPRGTRNEKQLISAKRGDHSVKPEDVQDAIDRMFPTQEKLELFARRQRPGWVCTGLDLYGWDVFDFVDELQK